MATKTTTRTKPATKEAKAQPAKAEVSGVTVKDVAAKLGTSEKSLRARIRKINGGTLPEGQTRYTWPSFNDPGLKELMKKLQGEKKADA